jgi:hypothetical protein
MRTSGMMATFIDRLRVFIFGKIAGGKLRNKIGTGRADSQIKRTCAFWGDYFKEHRRQVYIQHLAFINNQYPYYIPCDEHLILFDAGIS